MEPCSNTAALNAYEHRQAIADSEVDQIEAEAAELLTRPDYDLLIECISDEQSMSSLLAFVMTGDLASANEIIERATYRAAEKIFYWNKAFDERAR